MGRPRKGEEKGIVKWEPKDWEPKYDTIVLLSCLGFSRKDISEKMLEDYNVVISEQHISNIVNTKQAAIIKGIFIEQHRKRAEGTFADRLSRIADKTIKRLDQALNDDDLFKNSPFAVLDKGLAVLRGTGVLKAEAGGNTNMFFGAGVVTPAMVNDLMSGVREAEEVKKLHAAQPVAAEIKTIEKEKVPA